MEQGVLQSEDDRRWGRVRLKVWSICLHGDFVLPHAEGCRMHQRCGWRRGPETQATDSSRCDKEQQCHGSARKGMSRRLKMVCMGGAQSGTGIEGWMISR